MEKTKFSLLASAGGGLRKLTLLLAAFAGIHSAGAEQVVRGGVIAALVQPEPGVLTSNFDVGQNVSNASSKIFDGLVKLGPDLKLVPELATAWEISEDGLTVTFHLRRGVKWHDGHPFTSSDVSYSIQEIWRKFQPRLRSVLASLEEVQTPNEETVVLKLSRPAPALLLALHRGQAQILPRHLYEGTDVLRNPHNIQPIGTGPFRFKQWDRGDRIVLERNPDYWDQGKPYLDRVVLRFIPDAAARSAAFERGDLQFGSVNPVAHGDVDRLASLPHLKVIHSGYESWGTTVSMEFNLRNPILQDLRVRKAIAQAIDRDRILRSIYNGLGKVSTGPVPSSLTQFYTPDTPQYPYDTSVAEQLLDQAGYLRKGGGARFSLRLDGIPFSDTDRRTSEFIRQSLKKIGIEVEARNQDLPRFFQRVYTDSDFDLATVPMSATGDPQIGLERYYASTGILKGVPFTNASGYRNPHLDAIFDAAHVEIDPAKRVELYRQFQRIAQTDLPSYPLFEIGFSTVYATTVHGLSVAPDSAVESFAGVWLSPAAAAGEPETR